MTPTDLIAAYKRAAWLRRAGISFERAMATPLIATALTYSAKHRLRRDRQPDRCPDPSTFILE